MVVPYPSKGEGFGRTSHSWYRNGFRQYLFPGGCVMNLFEKQSRLNQLFTQSPVNAAYLAGSLANRTSFGHLSDVDIAILLKDQIKSDQFLDYQLYFFSELAKRLESDSIDVVILNQASLLLKLQVIKYGQILFSRDEKQRVMFETKDGDGLPGFQEIR